MTGVLGAAMAGRAVAQTSASAMAPGPGRVRWPAPEHLPLWPGKPPASGASLPTRREETGGPPTKPELWIRGVASPSISVYRPAHPDGRAVLVMPGGGYQFLSVENEGIRVAHALTPANVTVFVLEYRLPDEGWARDDVALQDAQRAMRLIRSHAATWRIDPARLGVMGFSAGGHLAGALSTALDARPYAAVDAADTQSARPAYAALIYPAMSAGDEHWGPERAHTERFVRSYDNIARLGASTPPLFLLHALDDPVVPVSQTLRTIEAARTAKVPVEAHVIERGGHGFGAANLPASNPDADWLGLFERWSRQH